MSKTRILSVSFIIACMLCACGEDSQSVSTSGGDSNLCGGKQCKSNQKCVNNKCVSDDDDSDEVCKKTQNTCEDDETLKKCVKGKKPVLEDCEDGYCEDGECLEKGGDQVDEVCKKAEEYCASKKELIICVKGEKPKKQKCSELAAGSMCLDSQCTVGDDPKVGVGDPCTDSAECPEGTYCDVGASDTCVKYGALGEPCSETQCSTDLMCFEDVCVKKVNIGEHCDEHAICDSGDCRNGICVTISTEYGECNEQLACPEGSVCIDKTCVPTKGSCSSNKECIGDSYCCLDESCQDNANVCVPYSSENPFDPECKFKTVKGMFEAAVQCYWEPKVNPESNNLLNSVVVGKIHNNKNIEKPLIAFISTEEDYANGGMLRIIHPETCEDVESLPLNMSESRNNLAMADFDGDGYMEIVVNDYNRPAIYKWDESKSAHVATTPKVSLNISRSYGTFSIHDLDNDGVPEIIASNGTVVHADGTVLAGSEIIRSDLVSPPLGDLNGDGNVEFITDGAVYRWMPASNGWTMLSSFDPTNARKQIAYADFGTPGASASQFDFEHLDGKAEIVIGGMGYLHILAVFAADGSVLSAPQTVMSQSFAMGGHAYPPAIGDFNGDGKPEIGIASLATFGVYDPKCKAAEAGRCKSVNTVWESPTQDISGFAGASAFDFDGDGKIEIVYGDECFTRVYDGLTGEVLFSSYRNSATVIEYPVIADVDDDGSTEIVIASDHYTCGKKEDSSHRGVKCETDSDCYSGSCGGGLCRCTSDDQCNWQTIRGEVFKQYACLAPLDGDSAGGNVCRAVQGIRMPGVTVLRDRLDRWVSSRTVWNQHAYNITNVNDNGTIPKTSDWKQNFMTEGLNNYRQQKQGSTGAGVAPDITGRFTSAADACSGDANGISLKAQVCNRGTKAVGSKMPAVFYKGSVAPENILCVSYTEEMVPVKDCRNVSCAITKQQAEQLSNAKIVLVVNDDGKGGKTTVECNESNNTDEITMIGCRIN